MAPREMHPSNRFARLLFPTVERGKEVGEIKTGQGVEEKVSIVSQSLSDFLVWPMTHGGVYSVILSELLSNKTVHLFYSVLCIQIHSLNSAPYTMVRSTSNNHIADDQFHP